MKHDMMIVLAGFLTVGFVIFAAYNGLLDVTHMVML